MQELTWWSTLLEAWLKVLLKATHMATPRKAMTSTAIAEEMTPSPRSSRCLVLTDTCVAPCLWCVEDEGKGSGGGELVEGGDEGDGEEDDAGDEGGDRDGNPHLLAAALHRGHDPALHLLADGSGLDRQQTAEIAGVAGACEDGDEAVQRVD